MIKSLSAASPVHNSPSYPFIMACATPSVSLCGATWVCFPLIHTCRLPLVEAAPGRCWRLPLLDRLHSLKTATHSACFQGCWGAHGGCCGVPSWIPLTSALCSSFTLVTLHAPPGFTCSVYLMCITASSFFYSHLFRFMFTNVFIHVCFH